MFVRFYLLCFILSASHFSQVSYAEGPTITHRTLPGKIRVGSVDKDSPYAEIGLKPGDGITKVNGKPVDENSSTTAIDEAIKGGKPITIERGGKAMVLQLKQRESHERTSEKEDDSNSKSRKSKAKKAKERRGTKESKSSGDSSSGSSSKKQTDDFIEGGDGDSSKLPGSEFMPPGADPE